MGGPLEGIRVIDMTWALSGPFCTMVLGDLGAEVIKVENPLEGGDSSRKIHPFVGKISSYFLSVNRGKKSITANLRHPRAKELVLELVRKADVIVENFRPGVMDRLGLGYTALKAVNPRIIYAACSGFGQKGPYSHRPAFDVIIQGMAGTLSVTGEAGGEPVRVGYSIGDIGAGMFTAVGILAALHERQKSGEGQMIDIAMMDCQMAFLENAFVRYLSTGEIPERLGTRHPVNTPFQAFPTQDGYVVLTAHREDWWLKLCDVIKRPDLTRDDRFKGSASRTRHHKELEEILNPIFRIRTTAEWVADLEKADIACGPVNNIPQVAADPHTAAREMIAEVTDSKGAKFKVVNSPVKLSRTKAKVEKASPELGENTDEILTGLLNVSPEEVAALRAEKAI